MQLYMRTDDLLRLPINDDPRRGEVDNLGPLKDSILDNGWIAGNSVMICDGKISAGFRRVRALRELFVGGGIRDDFMVGVEIRRTMLVPMLLDVTKQPPLM